MPEYEPPGRIRIAATVLRHQLRDALDHVMRGGEAIISRNGRDEALLCPLPPASTEATEETPEVLLTDRQFRARVEERSGGGE